MPFGNFPEDSYIVRGNRPAGDPSTEHLVTVQGAPGGTPLPITLGAGILPTEDSADGSIGSPFGSVVIGIGGKDTTTGDYVAATFTNGDLNVNASFTGTVSQNVASWAGVTLGAPTAWGVQPTGNIIGTNTNVLNTVAVSGTFWQAVQPISGTVAVSNFPASQVVTLASTTITGSVAVTGTFWQATQPVSGTVAVSNFPVTQPVSGTVTALQGTSPWVTSLASTTITGSVAVTGTFWQATQPVSGTFWQATQPVSGTVAISNFPATQPISGTVTALQGTSPWVTSLASTTITGSVAVTGTFWQATQPVSGTVAISNFPATQPVSGTITALQGTSPWVTSLASTTITGTVAVTQSTSPWVVSLASTTITGTVTIAGTVAVSNFPATVAVTQSTSPWVVSLASTTITGSVAVTGTFWQAVQPVVGPTSTAAATTLVSVTSGGVTLLAANAARKEVTIQNASTVPVYIGLGTAPTTTTYWMALAGSGSANDGTGSSAISDMWKGIIYATVASTAGAVVVTELT